MLQRLTIRNYAIIDRVDIRFSEQMTIVTGETGAGKSILVGALSLILGKRADTRVLYNRNEKCAVEGHFNVVPYRLEDFFGRHDLDYAPVTLVRREISSSGKSRAFINDTPVTLDILEALGERLVSIHAQHETLELRDTLYHLWVLDAFAKNEKLLDHYRRLYGEYRDTQQSLNELLEQHARAAGEKDYLEFQLKEMEEAGLDHTDQSALESELEAQNHSEAIRAALSQSVAALEENEDSVTSRLNVVAGLLRSAEKYYPRLRDLAARLHTAQVELKDIAGELDRLGQSVQSDPARLEAVSERLNMLYRLQKKHRAGTVEELTRLRDTLRERLAGMENLSGETGRLQTQLSQLQEDLAAAGAGLSAARKKQIPALEDSVNRLLAGTGMEYARLKVHHEYTGPEKAGPNGFDDARFLFSPDKGAHYQDLHRIASGGELSRLMLCIQSLIAAHATLPTLIFDEIDTGISGEVAFKVGNLLEKLSKSHQVICITHLPQIAGKGRAHYFVYKETEGQKAITHIRELDREERIREIARMLGGDRPTPVAMENARELLGL